MDFRAAIENARNNPDVKIQPVFNPGQSQKSEANTLDIKPKMTTTEKRFATDFLEPAVESKEIIFWIFEPQEIRMVGQTYTPDFFAMWANGTAVFYEIKGKDKLLSERSASVKFRWSAAQFATDTIHFYWYKWTGEKWRKRRVIPKRKKHNQIED